MTRTALIIDHDDSFIWNIKFWLEPELQVSILNHRHLTTFEKLNYFDLIILSPGPKAPMDYPASLNILNSVDKPILGICLGFQMMILNSQGKVMTYSPPKHGKTSLLESSHEFQGLKVGRYHSIHCQPSTDFKILATSQDDHCVMWGQHISKKQMGFQFHPESFLTENPELYKKYILNWMSP